METKTIPTSKLRKNMIVVGNVAYDRCPLPCYVGLVRNQYSVVSVVHIKGDRTFPGWYIVTLSLFGLTLGDSTHILALKVLEDSWWHVPVPESTR